MVIGVQLWRALYTRLYLSLTYSGLRQNHYRALQGQGSFVYLSGPIIQSFSFGYANKASFVQKATLHSCWRSALPKPIGLFRCFILSKSNSKQHPECFHKTFSFVVTQETQALSISSEHLLRLATGSKR